MGTTHAPCKKQKPKDRLTDSGRAGLLTAVSFPNDQVIFLHSPPSPPPPFLLLRCSHRKEEVQGRERKKVPRGQKLEELIKRRAVGSMNGDLVW